MQTLIGKCFQAAFSEKIYASFAAILPMITILPEGKSFGARCQSYERRQCQHNFFRTTIKTFSSHTEKAHCGRGGAWRRKSKYEARPGKLFRRKKRRHIIGKLWLKGDGDKAKCEEIFKFAQVAGTKLKATKKNKKLEK